MFSLNELHERNPEAHAAFVEMEADAWNVQTGEIAAIDPTSPHFYKMGGELYFRDAAGDELAFIGGVWTC